MVHDKILILVGNDDEQMEFSVITKTRKERERDKILVGWDMR